MPGAVQHVEQEAVQDGPLAARALDHHVRALEDSERRPAHPDTAVRTGATRFYAEQRLDSGRGTDYTVNVSDMRQSQRR